MFLVGLAGHALLGRASHARQCWAKAFASFAATRDPRYATVTESHLDFFASVVGKTGMITDPHALEVMNRDWMGKYEGKSTVALRPSSTAEVSKILAYCNDRRLAVVPQGGNTGLVGGSVPVFDEVLLSTARLNQIRSFDPVSGTLVCGAGCILEDLDRHVGESGFLMPLDLGAKGSCSIGGNISTNAGGLRLLRYGSLHGSVLGVEAVLPDGTVLDLLQSLRKDNTGYDMKQLFIGAEGTLGVVTAASLQCAPKPASQNVMYLAVPSFPAALQVLVRARQQLGEILSAFEFLDAESQALVCQELPGVRSPLPTASAPFFLVVETSGSDAQHDSDKVERFLQGVMEEGLVEDGTIAQDSGQAAGIWAVREGITVALKHAGAVYKYDISLPTAKMYKLVEVMRERLRDLPVRVVGYGHLGDGNLHLNVSCKEYTPEVEAQIEPFVYEWTSQHRGSISAEHGLGRMKAECIGYSKPAEVVELMGRLKNVFDPNHILNPYKYLPQRVLQDTAGSPL